jgi:signal transduction histidine kinase
MIRRILGAPFAARTWRECGYMITGIVVAVPGLILAVLGIVFSVVSLVTVGLPFLAAVLALARLSVRWFRAPARFFLGWDWPTPAPLRKQLGVLLRDPTAWKALAYGLIRFPLNAVAAYLPVVAIPVGVLSLTYPVWWFASPTLGGVMDRLHWSGTLAYAVEGAAAMDHTHWAGTLLYAVEGVAAILVFPWWLRLLVGVDRLLAHALLAPSPDQARIAALESSRATLRADAEARLRRVERDLHDGTQARLVALGVTLSRVHRRVTDVSTKELVDMARGDVTAALGELRDIVRGLHPPALDEGLRTALHTLVSRSAVPVHAAIELEEEPAAATATAIYFTVAELLTNVARHAAATRVELTLVHDGDWLRLTVTDNGRGGARLENRPDNRLENKTGTGLSGLARRAESLDGTFALDSPPGGPTTVAVGIPIS